jgi:hypothetical protein
MTAYRTNRLFPSPARRCFEIAAGRGFFNGRAYPGGIEGLAGAFGASR